MTGFWLLTILQSLLVLYTVFNSNALAVPLEISVCIPLLLFLLVELTLGLWTLYHLVKSQALKFHLSQTNNDLLSTSVGSVPVESGEHIEMNRLS